MQRHSAERVKQFQANIFPGAWAAIADASVFNWHSGAHRPHSSQALAIDVFGLLKVSDCRDAVMGAIARELGLPSDPVWRVELEWFDESNALNERVPTQVDAVAISDRSQILFECKFTESGGSCSQHRPNARTKIAACDGAYRLRANADEPPCRCPLTGKGIRYWELIPQIYDVDGEADHDPCPFAFDAYQWMRNSVLARSISQRTGTLTRVAAVYPDAPGLATAEKIRGGGPLGVTVIEDSDAIIPLSYGRILDLAQLSAPDVDWAALRGWVEAKIAAAAKA